MVNLISMTVRNFLSIGAVTQAIRFDQSCLTLIMGQNLDAHAANKGEDHVRTL